MAEGTRERIIAAARKCFAASGYSGTSTKQIAAKAGVNESTLFRTFDSKERLFDEVVAIVMRENIMPEKLLNGIDSKGDFATIISVACDTLYSSLSDELVRIEYYAALERPQAIDPLIRKWMSGWVERIGRRIKREQRAGRARGINPSAAAISLNNSVYHLYVLNHIFHYRNPAAWGKHPSALRNIVDLWLRGVIHRPGK